MNNNVDRCKNCTAPFIGLVRYCPTCGTDLGFPNVRLATTVAEAEAFSRRFDEAQAQAQEQGLIKEFTELAAYVESEARVVVSMPAEFALAFLATDSSNYVGYDALVGANVRAPAEFANDSHRRMVEGRLFGSFAGDIVYGALSLDGNGLPSYGEIFVTLRNVTIEQRVSLLQMNSYDFFGKFGDTAPPGYRTDWTQKGKLVAVKMLELGALNCGQTGSDWHNSVLNASEKGRSGDEFVEAHIFGSFNLHSIEGIKTPTNIDKSRRSLVRTVMKRYESRKSGAG